MYKNSVDGCGAQRSNVPRGVRLAAGTVVMLFAGIIYGWSILKAPLAAEFGWSEAALGLNFTITMCFFCLGGILGGMITKQISHKLAMILSSVLVFLGFFCAAHIQNSIIALYLSYGGMASFGIGVIYIAVVSAVPSWFPEKRATASGVMMMFFGSSSLLLGSAVGYLMRASGWRFAYTLLGLSTMVVTIIGAFFVQPAGENVVSAKKPQKPEQLTNEKGENAAGEYSTGKMLREASFWKLYAYFVLLLSIGAAVISFAKDISLLLGASEPLAISLVGIMSMSNGIGRIFIGWVYDTIGWRKTMLIANAIGLAASLVSLFAVLSHSLPVLTVALTLSGLSYGSLPPISSGAINEFYGEKNFSLNFSVINTVLFPSSLSALISGTMITAGNGYASIYIMLAAFAVVAFVINLSLQRDPRH